MTTENSLAPRANETERNASQTVFSIPDELTKRYQIRSAPGKTESDRRIGLFSNGSPASPALEVANDKIVAHRHDRETVEALVKLAQHNGWESVAVEGSPEFRKAVWEEGARAGLEVSGYEPTFAERERLETQRREEAERQRKDAERQREHERTHKNGEQDLIVEAAEVVAGAAGADRESEELAELFLNGSAALREADPRLANALEVQAVMERHIVHAFDGDALQIEAANLESRQMISDVLRRGLDVTVRTPDPVRQIEPIQSPEMER